MSNQGKPQNIKFNYNTVQHTKIAKKLNQLLSQLTNWLKDYQNNQQFPQVAEGSKTCDYCQFAKRCDRTQVFEEAVKDSLPNFDSIQEVSLNPIH